MKHSVKHLLKHSGTYHVRGTLWIEYNGERFFGPGRVELLECIAETGSLNKAAKKMGMSYKKAWEMVASLNKQTKTPLVLLQSGGEKGGGSTLSPLAHELIAYHQRLRERFAAFLAKEDGFLIK